MLGVCYVVLFEGIVGGVFGVVVVVDYYWQVCQVLVVLEFVWDNGLYVKFDFEGIWQQFVSVFDSDKGGFMYCLMGDGLKVFDKVDGVIIVEVEYIVLYFVYMMMELINCIVQVMVDGVYFWVFMQVVMLV